MKQLVQTAIHRDCLVSAIVSMYNSEKFICGCLESLLHQTIADKLEIILVNSGSQQNEDSIIKKFSDNHNNITCIQTRTREPLYQAWNRAAVVARGAYLVNTNTDDRLSPVALEKMARVLDSMADVGVVYIDQFKTEIPNETFEHHHSCGRFNRDDYAKELLVRKNPCGPQVMWRRRLHDQIGYFREDYEVAGDWEFWLRTVFHTPYRLFHISEPLGLYFVNRDGLELGGRKQRERQREIQEIKSTYERLYNRETNQAANKTKETARPGSIKKRVLLTTSAAPDQSPFSTSEKHPPLGIGFLISVLKNAGHEVFFIDNYLQPSNFLETEFLQKNKIDFVGIYANTICFRDTLRMFYNLEYLRQTGKWHGKIIVGGPHTSVALDTIPDFVDHVVQGEGEYALLDIVERRCNQRIVKYPAIENLDDLPMPAWDCFINLPYKWNAEFFSQKPVFTMNTSRGCPFNCAFCSVGSIWGNQYTCFSAERIVSDIEHLIHHYGARGIYFREDNFTLDKKRLCRFCNLLIEKNITIPWACESRVTSVDQDTLPLMVQSGLCGFYFGVESGSQRMLDFMNKGITVDQIRDAFALCRQYNIKTAASVVVGIPEETEDDLQQTATLLKEIKPTVTWHNVFVGIPRSKLYDYTLQHKLYDFIDDRGLVYLKGHNDRVKHFYKARWNAAVPFAQQKQPDISVVMAVYNGETYVKKAIQSILDQTCPGYEFIIINDASTDATESILRSFDDPRMHIITNGTNLGLTRSLNRGIGLARGRYIARMDADDISLPHRLATQIAFLESNKDHALVGSSYYSIDETGKINALIEVLKKNTDISRGLLKKNWFGHGSLMFRKEAFDEIGGYNNDYVYAQDYDFVLRLSEKFKLANIEEPLYCWRSTPSCISSAKQQEQNQFKVRAQAEATARRSANKAALSGKSPGAGTPTESSEKVARFCKPRVPVVSVIVPTFNRPRQLAQAVKSILGQTFADFEIIVVNDAGMDAASVLSAFHDNRIRYMRHEENQGLAAARNTGIRVARGTHIAYLDDDDIYYSDHLQTLIEAVRSSQYRFAYTDACRIHKVRQKSREVTIKRDVPYSIDFERNLLLVKNITPVTCIMHEKSCCALAGYFDETLTSHEDWDLWIRMSRHFDFIHIKKVTCEYSWRADGTTMTSSGEEDYLRTRKIIYERYAHLAAGNTDIIDRQQALLKKISSKVHVLRQDQENMLLVSLIVPVWNNITLTRQFLEAISENTGYPNYEVIIVDNGSSDETKQFLACLGGDLKIITNPENRGFAKACNQGARAAQGNYLVFLNNDTIPQKGWLAELVRFIVQHPESGIVGAKLLYPDNTIQHCGAAMRFDRKFFRHPYKHLEKDHPLVNTVRECDAVTAACFITPRKVFFEIGMFDEVYLNGCEDMDYCTAVRNRQYKIYYNPRAVLYHLESKTPRAEKKDRDNFQHYLSKWGTDKMKNEIEVYAEDNFWAFDKTHYRHNYNNFTIQWHKELKNAEQRHDLQACKKLGSVLHKIYPVETWSKKSAHSPTKHTQPAPRKQKILFVCHDFPPYRYAGAQLYAQKLARAINDGGFATVDIFYPVFREDYPDKYAVRTRNVDGLRLFELPKEKSSEPEKIFNQHVADAFSAFLQRHHYDCIHFHGLGQLSLAPLHVARNAGLKILFTFHDYWFLCDRWHMIRKDQQLCSGPESIDTCTRCFMHDNGIAPTEAQHCLIRQYKEVRRREMQRAFGLIDRSFSPSRYLHDVFDRFGFAGMQVQPLGFDYRTDNHEPATGTRPLTFGFIGQIIRRKGVNFVIEAFRALPRRDIRLQVWGKLNPRNEYAQQIIRLCQDDDRIELHGAYVPVQLPKIFAGIDMALVPSLMENFPLVVQEAFIHRTPVIAARVGGIPEVLEDGVNGFMVSPGSANAFRTAMQTVIDRPEFLQKFTANIHPVRHIREDACFFVSEYLRGTRAHLQPADGDGVGEQPKRYTVQFYVYKNVHWPMFEALFEYLHGRTEVREIVLCLPNLPQLLGASDNALGEKLLRLDATCVARPRSDADITFVADALAGKVAGCGRIVNVGHGTISKGYYFTESVWTERENWVDLLCVPGAYARDLFQKVLRTRVAATGMPKLDPVFSGVCTRERLCAELGLNPQHKIVLYAPTFNRDLSSVFDFASRFHELHRDDACILIKLHGSTLPPLVAHYRRLAEKLPNFHFIADPNLAPYLGGADVMISDVSSAFMEFMALNKPVLLYNNPARKKYHGFNPENIEYQWRDLGTQTASFDELKKSLDELVASGDDGRTAIRHRYAEMLFADRSGHACEKVWAETGALFKTPVGTPLPVFSAVLTLTPDNLFAIRALVHNLQFYSVMPMDLVLVCPKADASTREFIAELERFSQFRAVQAVAATPNAPASEWRAAGLRAAHGDYLLCLDAGINFYKNFDYVLHTTFAAHPEIDVLTGLTVWEDKQIDCRARIEKPDNMEAARYAYEFINRFQGRETSRLHMKTLPPLLVWRRPALPEACRTDPAAFAAESCNRLHLCLSLFYSAIPAADMLALTDFWRTRNRLPVEQRLQTTREILKSYYFPDFKQLELFDAMQSGAPARELLTELSESLYMRFYDLTYKQQVLKAFAGFPDLCQALQQEIELTHRLHTTPIARPTQLQAAAPKTIGPRIMLYFFKNVHIPILLPIYRKLKEMCPDARIVFGYLPHAPKIRAGLTPNDLRPLQAFGEPLFADVQTLAPDLTFIADSVYPWVKGCDKLVHVGHGLLSKGQYYTDTPTARREEQADLVCVPGRYHQQIMQKIISKPVVATGMAKLDDLFAGRITAATVRQQFGLPDQYRCILYAPTFNDELSCNPCIGSRICEIIPDGQTLLLIKVHGSTKPEYRQMYRSMVARDQRVIYVDELDITPFLALADVMVSDVSSAMMEFAALDKPVVLFNNPGWQSYKHYNPDDIEFRWRDIGLQATSLEETAAAVARSFVDPGEYSAKRTAYTDQLLANKHDGRAAEKIVRAALSLLDRSGVLKGAA